MDLNPLNLKFNAEGLIPAIVQQASNRQSLPYGRVLMMGWMNRIALEQSLCKGIMHYWSRSRNKLWLKGETSGHIQKIVRWFVDCDRDTLLFYVDQQGGASCHSGFESCFFSELDIKNGKTLPIRECAVFQVEEVYQQTSKNKNRRGEEHQ